MATLTIRNLNEEVKRKLRIEGAKNNRSMEGEARAILEKSLTESDSATGLASMIREVAAQYGGIDLNIPDRSNDASDERLPDFRGK